MQIFNPRSVNHGYQTLLEFEWEFNCKPEQGSAPSKLTIKLQFNLSKTVEP